MDDMVLVCLMLFYAAYSSFKFGAQMIIPNIIMLLIGFFLIGLKRHFKDREKYPKLNKKIDEWKYNWEERIRKNNEVTQPIKKNDNEKQGAKIMSDIGTKRLETSRLILRKFERNDSESLYKNCGSDPKVPVFLSWNTHKDSIETIGIINKWIANYELPNTFNWAIEIKEVGEVIGNIMVVKYEVDNSACEIGYSIGSEYWNKGFAPEALQAVIDFLFSEVGLNRISAKHDILNPASGEVMKKCKMSHEGILRDVQFKNNRFCTLAVYSILKREWE